jgi:hypothetical protein
VRTWQAKVAESTTTARAPTPQKVEHNCAPDVRNDNSDTINTTDRFEESIDRRVEYLVGYLAVTAIADLMSSCSMWYKWN